MSLMLSPALPLLTRRTSTVADSVSMFTGLPNVPSECDGALPDQTRGAVDAGTGVMDGADGIQDAYVVL